MRVPSLILIALATTSSAATAEVLRLPPSASPQSARSLPLKGAAGSAGADGCAAYGRGFVKVEGTCVKIGGAVRVDAVTGR